MAALLLLGGKAQAQVTVGGSVYGGGNEAMVGGSCSVLINQGGATITEDVYGGGALAMVNTTDGTNPTSGKTTSVTLTQGTVNGSVYGGGLGQTTPENVAANVFGPVQVTVNGGSVGGSVFGCNNLNGTPKSTVEVVINGSDPTTGGGDDPKVYAIKGVYGGGNQAHYRPTPITKDYPLVTINGCATSIENVYGGGKAAGVSQTNVVINGGDIGRAFAGGDGDNSSNTPAHVGYDNTDSPPTTSSYPEPTNENGVGDANIEVKGGTIGQVFGGSNKNGVIRDDVSVTIDKNAGTEACEMYLAEVYGGGNMAAGNAGTITIGCTGTLTDDHNANPENIGTTLEGIGYVYGGANQANINNNIVLNINSGMVANVFGGNNTSGTISGSITVNVEKNDAVCGWYVGNVYGGGNLAAYTGSPTVNIKNGTVSQNVYGGGKGESAVVTGAPTVTIGDNTVGHESYVAEVTGDVYGGGDAGNVVGTPVVTVVNKCNTTIGSVYGGGNAADVSATDVTIDGGNITGDVFGGGHGDKDANPPLQANVAGDTYVNVTGGTINRVFGGSNSKGTIGGTISVDIAKGDNSCDMHITEVYGGGNFAASNVGNITIGCMDDNDIVEYVYGGANQADITGDIHLIMTGGRVGNLFGGNNTSGTISGSITVDVEKDDTLPCESNWYLGNVFGGGNLATFGTDIEPKAPTVNIKNGTVSGNVYGGGKGNSEDHTKGQVTGNPVVTIGDNDESYQVTVSGSVFGGGDAGNVIGTPAVSVIEKCNTEITTAVYGGGNAADVSATNVIINGGIIGNVFGGGNGAVAPANVTEATGLAIHGGTINRVFAGGNTSGTIGTNSGVTINKTSSCAMKIVEVYGGGNLAAGNAGTITIGCTGTKVDLAPGEHYGIDREGIRYVYGGANEANITGDITLNINSGIVENVFGGNNTSGAINGTIEVNINKNNSATCANEWYVGDVYGGGNHAAYGGTPIVNIQNGTVSGSVFGGGNDITTANAGVVGSDVEMTGGIVLGGIYGGCNLNGTVTSDSEVNILGGVIGSQDLLEAGTTTDVFGGGLGENTQVNGNVTVTISRASGDDAPDAPTIYGDVYGGSALGNVNTENGSNTTTVNILDGTLHSVTDNSTGFTVYHGGNVYGGGLGRKADSEHSAVEAKVFGAVTVNIGTGTPSLTETGENFTGNATIGGNVYGANNTNGSPQDNVTVNIYRTAHTTTDEYDYDPDSNEGVPATFAIANVFGGGNEANYAPENGSTNTTKKATVNIYGCYNTIRRSFGGGNAAATPSVETDIQGGRFFQVFGGGNGERGSQYAANINGDLTLSIHGGNVGQFYGISNQYGNVSGTATVNTDNSGPCGAMMIDEFFCGGNYADITGDLVTTISCSEGMRVSSLYGGCHQANITGNVVLNVEGGTFENVYGGSKGVEGTPANITGNVTLNLYGGIIGNVYGGSNVNGNIGGIITVNVVDVESPFCPLHITNIYGGSNETDYTPTYTPVAPETERISPVVNVVHAKYGISGNVYGGSKGKENAAIPTAVNSHPLVNIGYNSDMNTYLPSTYEVPASPRAIVAGDVYGGGDAAKVEGNTAIFLRNRAKVFGNVYGGGNMGEVSGNTKVIVNGDNE